MPAVSYVEKTIFELEGVKVDFVKEGKNTRSEVTLKKNYGYQRQIKNSANVSDLRDRLKGQYEGYDFIIYKGDGDKARGNMLMGTLRDTYGE